ncbi:mandelate racemase/muconate lactonizing enzyme family protein [Daejeonella lutea]|uniref:Dipeptide epimerase n=1 Tax=Daejeonella lutea TaxID=572036 RepID=A0A1T5F7Y1_9SPHI|nr:dipeptide epimerase [Daejeonella lutea]SKB92273.1 L-alanine-DL-glutamate epimerase [Daejeonella lutea]
MKIRSIKAYKRSLALKKPYTIARDTFYDTENVFLEIELQNGITGLGAACPEGAVVGETAEKTIKNLESDLVQQLVGKDIREFLGHISEIAEIYGHFPGTMAAIDIALHDAFGQWLEVPVVDFYGRKHKKMLTSITIGIKNVEETIEEAKEYYDQGFRALKVKTGLDSREDAERILKLREVFNRHFSIRVDANTGYDAQQLGHFLDLTKNADVEVIEQPFLPGKENDLLQFSEELRSVFTADESLTSPATALSLTKAMPYGIFNIKLMKCGGIRPALQIADIARHADIKLFWGCNDESLISITAALHAALSCSHTRFLDLDGSFDLAEDLAEGGFVLEDGFLTTNSKSGLGLTKL